MLSKYSLILYCSFAELAITLSRVSVSNSCWPRRLSLMLTVKKNLIVRNEIVNIALKCVQFIL